MANTRISELATAAAVANSVVPASNAGGTLTSKVTLQSVARLFSDPTGITGADQVTNIVSLTQSEYDNIGAGNYDASTVYIITG